MNSNNIILNYQNVNIKIDENEILKDVSFSLSSGEFCYLVGPVGSGKSTLLKSVYADRKIDSGSAQFLDYDLIHLKKKQIPYLRRHVGIIFQDFQLLQDRSVVGNLEFVLRATGWKVKRDIEERISKVLSSVNMEHKGYKMPYELSGGEQQRVVIARALLNTPELILADEPTGNLDPNTGEQIVKILKDISKAGTAVVMSTHNLGFVSSFPARTMKIENQNLLSVYNNRQDNSITSFR